MSEEAIWEYYKKLNAELKKSRNLKFRGGALSVSFPLEEPKVIQFLPLPPTSQQDEWFRTVSDNICLGFKTASLPPSERQLYWDILNTKVEKHLTLGGRDTIYRYEHKDCSFTPDGD